MTTDELRARFEALIKSREACQDGCAENQAMTDSATLSAVIAKFRERESSGVAKYGTTMDRNDLSRLDWLRHAQEEAMDLALYLQRAIDVSERMAWQPIDVAPKDGTLFLVWVHAEQYGEDDNGQPYVANMSFADIGWWRNGTDPVPYGYVDYGAANTYDMEVPTHWMPLPEPPVEARHG